MNKFKKAFTLIEMMAVMFIISIVVIVTMATQKPFDRGTAMLYQRAYSALALASYNVYLDLTGAATFPTDASDLCLALSKSSGTDAGYINTASVGCTDNVVSTLGNSFPDTAIQFITANGMKVYFTDRFSITIGSNPDIWYRIVFVDLNGDTKPNTAQWSEKKLADIVGFVLTDEGDVFPIGYPEADKRYLTARVHYPDTTTSEDIYSNSMSYHDAKSKAWGLVTNYEELKSINFLTDTDHIPPGSYLQVDYTKFADPPSVDLANKCLENDPDEGVLSPCEVDINEYNN